MINSLSFRKIFVIVVLALLAAVLYVGTAVVFAPKQKTIQNEFRAKEADYNAMLSNMDNLVSGLAMFDEQKDKFDKLNNAGFLDDQDRLNIRNLIIELQKESGLSSARYTIGRVEEEENKKAKEAGYKIISTKIGFNLEAFSDADIYEFIYLVNYGFKGQVSIIKLDIQRDLDVTPTLIQRIGLGEDLAIVQADMTVALRTMVYDPESPVNNKVERAY